MAKIVFTKDNLVSPEEFRAMLDQMPPPSATEALFDLSRGLFAFEKEFNLASDVFYTRFMRGEMGDDMPFMEWAGCYKLYLEIKHDVDRKLAMVAVPA